MNLRNKRKLISRVLKVGANRIILDIERKDELKEAITRQDIKDLKKQGAIKIKEVKGRKKIKKRKTKRRMGSIKKRVKKKKKREYINITRKLRKYIKILRDKKRIGREIYIDFRKKIRARTFNDLAHLKEAVKQNEES